MMRARLLLLFPVLAACAAGPGGDAPGGAAASAAAAPTSLAGTRWIGVVDPGVEAEAAPRIEFIEGRVHGFTGCNMMSGSWRMEGAEARFSSVATTRRMCLGPGGEIEKRLLAAMGDASRVRRVGDRLVIEAPSGARFEFREAK
jgi:heat shock protein HslJ